MLYIWYCCSWFSKRSEKLVRLMLAILRNIKLSHRNNLGIHSTDAKQPSYETPLHAHFENIAWNVCRGGFTAIILTLVLHHIIYTKYIA